MNGESVLQTKSVIGCQNKLQAKQPIKIMVCKFQYELVNFNEKLSTNEKAIFCKHEFQVKIGCFISLNLYKLKLVVKNVT